MTTQPERDSIEIKTACRFIPEQSDVEAERYVFAYHITIRNTGSVSAQEAQRSKPSISALRSPGCAM